MPRPLPPLLAALALALLVAPGAAGAESALRLPLPTRFGDIQAGTYAENGERLGSARLRIERLPEGRVRLESSTGIDGSARTVLTALLELAADGESLRLLSQRSESLDQAGAPLGVLSIDHERRRGTCTPPPGAGPPASVTLPADDRVVNVPLLLFQRLASGEEDGIDFQILLCRAGARLVGAHAAVAAARGDDAQAGRMIEVRTDMDFGPILSRLAAPFLPRLSVWFDPSLDGGWVGHRVPLFSKGPTVVVVRSGVAPSLLGVGR